MAYKRNRTAPAAGQLDKLVFILSREDIESGDYSCEESVSVDNEVWANVVNVSGTKQIDSRNAGSTTTHIVSIRFRYDISAQKYFLYQDATGNKYRYAINTVQSLVDDKGTFQVCDCMQIEKDQVYNNPSPEIG